MEPALPAKPREAGLPTYLCSPEECSVRSVDALQGPALQTRGQFGGLRIASSPFGQSLGLINVSERQVRLPVRPNSFFQSRVVELTLQLQDFLESPVLSRCRQKSISVREDHRARLQPSGLTK
jgi:hypothetical protein